MTIGDFLPSPESIAESLKKQDTVPVTMGDHRGSISEGPDFGGIFVLGVSRDSCTWRENVLPQESLQASKRPPNLFKIHVF